MKMLFLVPILLVVCHVTSGCKPVGEWRRWSMEEIIYNQKIVVFGKETERFNPSSQALDRQQDARFQVYCVLKNDDPMKPIPENIVIEQVFPVTSCSGTKITTGIDIILGLRRTESTENFMWDEPNIVPDGAAFNSTPEVLDRATRVCGLESPVTPQGRQPSTLPKCPSVAQNQVCTSSSSAMEISPCVPMLVLVVIAVCLHVQNMAFSQ